MVPADSTWGEVVIGVYLLGSGRQTKQALWRRAAGFPDLVLAWRAGIRHTCGTDRRKLVPDDFQPNIPVYQIKLFKGKEDEAANLEHEVNAWLGENRVKVLQIIGNIAPQTLSAEAVRNVLTRTNHPPSDILVIVLYERD